MQIVSSLKRDSDESVLVKKYCCEDLMCTDCQSTQIPSDIMFNPNLLLSRQYRAELEVETDEKIFEEAGKLQLSVSQHEIDQVERLTRLQSQCDLWRWIRLGRITASILRQCIHASPTIVPSKMSLLNKICHPYRQNAGSEAIRYGRNNEPKAKKKFATHLEDHRNIRLHECGIFIDKKLPFLAASPDIIMECDCCGRSTVEIKCPFRLSKRSQLSKVQSLSDLNYLVFDGQCFQLNPDHEYFLQVLAQVHICDVSQGFFYVWSKNEQICIKLERNETMWQEACKKATTYFYNIVCPELLVNYYSNKNNVTV